LWAFFVSEGLKMRRPKPAKRLRGRAAVEQRQRRLRKFPLCAVCLEDGIVKATDEIDHIIPLDDGGPDTDENCQGLCFEHHRQKTNYQRHGIERKHGYEASGRPLDPSHPWNATGEA